MECQRVDAYDGRFELHDLERMSYCLLKAAAEVKLIWEISVNHTSFSISSQISQHVELQRTLTTDLWEAGKRGDYTIDNSRKLKYQSNF